MGQLLKEIKGCKICQKDLPLQPRPIVQFSKQSKILIIGQAPGIKAHETNKPWNDKSGERLRDWLGLSENIFYNPKHVAIVPMGFCYPGKGKSGDLPPRKECAQEWMEKVKEYLINIKLEIYIGKYACDREFGKYKNLTSLVREKYTSEENKIILPHPSPRNNIWLAKNPWFLEEVVPFVKKKCSKFTKF